MKKKIIWTIIAVIIIIAAALGIVYYTTDAFKTSQQLFYRHFESESKLVKNIGYEDLLKNLKEQQEKNVETSGEITANITSTDSEMQQIGDALKKGKIKYDAKSIGKENKKQIDMTLEYDSKDVLSLNILQNKDQYGIRVKDLYDKFVSVENNNLKALAKTLGVDESTIPDKIDMIDYYELLNIDNDTLKHIKDTYYGIIKDNIPEECYNVEKDVSVEINGSQSQANAYKLTLTEEQLKNVMVRFFETLKSDDKTLDLIVSKYNSIPEIYREDSDNLTKETIVENLTEELEYLNELEATSDEILNITVYDTNENMARIEVKTNKESFNFDMFKEADGKNGITMLYSDDSQNQLEVKGTFDESDAKALVRIESEGTNVEIGITENVKSGDDITVEDFSESNSVKINDMSEEEIGKLVQTIYTNIEKVLPEKMQMLGINL